MRLLSFVFILLSFISYSQKQAPAPVPALDHSIYAGIRWRELGPFRGGRSSTATGVRGNPNVYYFGGVGGGIWKTEDAGQTWNNLTDAYFGGTVGAVAVSDSDPNLIFAGEGEQTLRNNVSSGWGVWRST
ncbi:MAG: WD40/YVTN/BNR-like repeat-containing protein, partial [Bacteroidota bacterium]